MLKECDEYKKCKCWLSKEFEKLLIDFNEDEIVYIIEHQLEYIRNAS